MRLTAEARIVVVNIARRPEPETLLTHTRMYEIYKRGRRRVSSMLLTINIMEHCNVCVTQDFFFFYNANTRGQFVVNFFHIISIFLLQPARSTDIKLI